MSKTIQQLIQFDARPDDVYSALIQADQFAGFTGQRAAISPVPGGEFNGFDGVISGRNIELIPNQRIVQAWRVGTWPEGVFSLVRFDLNESAAGTQLTLTQAAYPDDAHDHLDDGWHKMYWEPLRDFLSQRKKTKSL